MTCRLMYYPGATPRKIPAPGIEPQEQTTVTTANAKRDGLTVTIADSFLWAGSPPNVVTIEDSGVNLYYFVAKWDRLSREQFRLTAEYSAVMTSLYNGFKCDITCNRYSEPDGPIPSITNEPLLDPIAPTYGARAYSTYELDNPDDIGIAVTMATDIYGRLIEPTYDSQHPLSDRVQQPVTVLLDHYSSESPYTFDDAMYDLNALVHEAGTNANIIQRIQLVPKRWVTTKQDFTFLNDPNTGEVFVAIGGRVVTPGTRQLLYALAPLASDYSKAVYYDANVIVRSWGANIATIPYPTGSASFNVGYSLVNGINPFVALDGTGPGYSILEQIPITIPDIVSVGDYYTAWYTANKEQILTQGATAALAVVGSVAAAVAAVASGGSLLVPALGVGGALLNAVNTGVSIDKQKQEARRSQLTVGTSATAAYTNSKVNNQLDIFVPTIKVAERRKPLAKYGYSSNRTLDRIPTESDSPRRVWCSLAGSATDAEWPNLSGIQRPDHLDALNAELSGGLTIWYAGTIGDFSQLNYTK